MNQRGGVEARIALAAGILIAAFLGFAMGRIVPAIPADYGIRPISPTASTPAPTTPAVSSGAASDSINSRAAAPVKPDSSGLTERLAAINAELSKIPVPQTDRLKALSQSIRKKRLEAANLTVLISNADRELLTANAQSESNSNQVEFQQALHQAEEELGDAKRSVLEQQQVIASFDRSDDTVFMKDLRNELAKREAAVAEIKNHILAIFDSQKQNAGNTKRQRSQVLNGWRETRATYEHAYTANISATENDLQAYSDLAAENAANQKKIDALVAERAALMGRGASK